MCADGKDAGILVLHEEVFVRSAEGLEAPSALVGVEVHVAVGEAPVGNKETWWSIQGRFKRLSWQNEPQNILFNKDFDGNFEYATSSSS